MKAPLAIVTGASSGIGRAVAILLASRGYRTVLISRRAVLLRELADKLGRLAPSRIVRLDLSVPSSIADAIGPVLEEEGPASVLVNCAGYGVYKPALEQGSADNARLMRVNHESPLEMIRSVLPGMLARRCGHVFSISSMSARIGPWGHVGYAASKSAMRSATESLAAEFPARESGVHFTVVYPGIVRTPYFDLPGMDVLWRRVQHRAIEPERVARAIVLAMGCGLPSIYIPWHYRLLDIVAAVNPSWALALVRMGSRPRHEPAAGWKSEADDVVTKGAQQAARDSAAACG